MTQVHTNSWQAACDHAGSGLEPALSGSSPGDGPATTQFDLEQSPAVTQPLDLSKLRHWINAATPLVSQLTGRRFARVSFAIVDDQRMSELHRKHLGAEHTTDVLTFIS